MKFYYCLLIIFVSLYGCSATKTILEKSGTDKSSFKNRVSFTVNNRLNDYFPKCIAVLPFNDPKALDVMQEFQKAFHAQLSTTGIRLIPLQAGVSEKILETSFLDCDMKMTGLVLENKRKHYGIYSEYSAGVTVKLIHIESGNVFWKAAHKLTKRGGTIPIGIISTVTGIFSANKNIEEEQTGRITYEIAHQVVQTIPNLQFDQLRSSVHNQETSDEVGKKNCPEAMHEFIATSDNLKKYDKVRKFERELRNKKVCKDQFSLRILAQAIQQIDHNSIEANDWLIKYYYENEDFVDVIKTADLLISEGHDLPEHRMRKGDSLRKLNRYDEAMENFLFILADDKTNEQAYFLLGKTYVALGRFDIAGAAFERSLAIEPENTDTMLFAGLNYAAKDNLDGAFDLLRKALAIEIAGKNIQKSRIIVNAIQSIGAFDRLSQKDLAFIKKEIKNF